MNRHFLLRYIIISVITITVISFAGLASAGWYYAGEIKAGALIVDEHPSETEYDLKVLSLNDGKITLGASQETKHNGDWKINGIFGLERLGGYDQVGPIIKLEESKVTREYIPISGNLKVGDMVSIDSFAFPMNPMAAHDIPFSKVNVFSPMGKFPAWLINAESDKWTIVVHGKGADRREALRMLPTLVKLDHTSLIITYRNDENLPRNPDGFYKYGETEWQDLEGAVRYAKDNGAETVILVGYSMGGAIVTSFLYKSELATIVEAVILDSPLLNLSTTIDHAAKQRNIPGILTTTAKAIAEARFKIDLDKTNYLARSSDLAVPILLIHGDSDKRVPIHTSDILAASRPDIVDFVRMNGTNHMRAWNSAPDIYESHITIFLNALSQ